MTVVRLVTHTDVTRESAVAHLERALELAKAGQIECVAVAAVQTDGSALWLLSDSDKPVTLLGAVQALAHLITQELVT